MRVGVIGTGFMGRVHCRAIRAAGAELIAVAGSRTAAAAELVREFPGTEAVGSLDELLARDVDVVHVCTPNALHESMARLVLDAGSHVVCEKPLGATLDEATSLTDVAARSGLVAAVPFVYRYYPSVLAARDRIRLVEANPLWLLHGRYVQDWLADPAATNWRVESAVGGASRAFADIGVHWCDLMEFVTGQRIIALNATFATAFASRGKAGAQTPVSTEDGGVMTFRTDRGATGSLVISQASAGRKNQLWFSFDGPRETYVFDQEQPEALWIGDQEGSRTLVRDPGRGSTTSTSVHPLPAGHPEGYARVVEDFVRDVHRAIRGDAVTALPTFVDGLRAACITATAVQSSREGRWLDVPA